MLLKVTSERTILVHRDCSWSGIMCLLIGVICAIICVKSASVAAYKAALQAHISHFSCNYRVV